MAVTVKIFNLVYKTVKSIIEIYACKTKLVKYDFSYILMKKYHVIWSKIYKVKNQTRKV